MIDMQIQTASGIDQSGILTSQAVITYKAVGPTTNGKSVLDKYVASYSLCVGFSFLPFCVSYFSALGRL
jgi:hypothetical protein